MDPGLVLVKCQILSGAFSGERVIEVQTPAGTNFVAIAPREYCHKLDGSPIGIEEPMGKQKILGTVSARLIRNGGHVARVLFPDGEDAEVDLAMISPRSSETSNVSIGS